MKDLGFVRLGACSLDFKLSSPDYNVNKMIEASNNAINQGVDVLCFPELSITGYTCQDLFFQEALIDKSLKALEKFLLYSKDNDLISILGMPINIDNVLYNCALVIKSGEILGVNVKSNIINEKRWFKTAYDIKVSEIELLNQKILVGNDLIYKSKEFSFGVEISDDLLSVNPISNKLCNNGATVIFNLSASNDLVSKNEYRKNLISTHSYKLNCAYIFVSSNLNESSSDLLFSGAKYIYENGELLNEGERFLFDSDLIFSDIDVEKLKTERYKNKNFNSEGSIRIINFNLSNKKQELSRNYSKTPFIVEDVLLRDKNYNEILNIQSFALIRRMKQINIKSVVLGLSGGLDSALAFLVCVKAFKQMKLDLSNIICVTMPGFGTSKKTYNNSLNLAKAYGVTLLDIDIKKACMQHFSDIKHDENIHDVTYENSQARERTQILMDLSNKYNAIVIGTGDLSELALGWCTYNGDHMSMYSINAQIPKTLVKDLVKFVYEKEGLEVLKDIVYTPISPELLPVDDKGNISQKTEDKVGPYILHDFFLYHFLRYNIKPIKILALANKTFKDDFKKEEIKKWLNVFIKRFFTQQFKRNCMPDGVKVIDIGLSCRGDLVMPSDISYSEWLDEIK